MKKLLITALALVLPLAAIANTYTISDANPIKVGGKQVGGGDGDNSTLDSLSHGTAYTWGFTNASLGGQSLSALETSIHSGSQVIKSATLTLTGISDWTTEAKDVLYIDILNNLSSGVKSTTYMPQVNNDTVYGDDPFNPNSKLVSFNKVTGKVVNYSSTLGSYNTLLTGTSGHVKFQSAQPGALIQASSATTTSSKYNPAGDPGTFTAVNTTSAFTITYDLTTANLALLQSFLGSDAVGGSTAGEVLGLGFGPDCHFFDTGVTVCITTGPGRGLPDGGMTFGLLGLSFGVLAALARKSRRSNSN